ncbi:MAG TPA: hypothetical protein VGQ72_10810 [Pyrinomonadaceae bacterium]|nr:hypothetical protein [Pyrinomonadaceae bacterium]
MKPRMTLSIAFAIGVLALIGSYQAANAQQVRRFRFDTGVLTLNNPDQILRVTINWGDGSAAPASVRFRRFGYIEQGNIYTVASENTSDPITLQPGEAAHVDISQGGFAGIRGVVFCDGSVKDMEQARVTVQIISQSTGRVEAVLIALLLP